MMSKAGSGPKLRGCDADERLGVSGRDAVIQEAAQQYATAANNHDMAAVWAALHAIEDRARKLAAATNTGRCDHA